MRPFHNDNSAFYSGRAITRAIGAKRGNIVRPYKLMRRLSPSWFDEPEQISGKTLRRWAPNAIESERSQSKGTADVAETVSRAEVVEKAQSVPTHVEGLINMMKEGRADILD
jgi:hypothetical protein